MSILHDISEVHSVEQVIQSSGLSELVAFPHNGGDIIGPVRSALDQNGLMVDEMFVEKGRLEDVFRNLTIGGALNESGDETGDVGVQEVANHA